ncbi:sensor histidine kinase [Methanoplanus limicola]|uniref:histidine kinase n=1 Tax=Methanoplanus limicola DSM 2279 TaxID=937775 RepID=H1YWK9_9EURY|nr:ATP-binding protein [Methanoplanus limicola]EHQ35811.1 multi-sensor signal transduction histidine kinase [Methanoplanus limicola DSM 2279]
MSFTEVVSKSGLFGSIEHKDVVKLSVIGCLIIFSVLITTIYFQFSFSGTYEAVIFLIPQLYYIPIILITVWYPKRGILASVLIIAGFLLAVTYFYYQGLRIDPFIAGINAALFLWVGLASAYIAKSSGIFNFRYFGYFYNSKNGILIVDAKNLKIIDANPKICKISGQSHNKIIGKNLTVFLYNLGLESSKTDKIIDKSGIINEKIIVKCSDDDEKIFLVTSVENNKEDNIECTFIDITESEREKKDAIEEKELFRRFVDSSDNIFFMLDKTGKIFKIHWSKAKENNIREELLCGRYLSQLLGNCTDEDCKKYTDSILSSGSTKSFKSYILTSDGLKKSCSVISGPLNDSAGNTIGIIGSVEFIFDNHSETFEEDKNIGINYEMNRWNFFVNNAAHELRTPLQPIVGYLNLLLDDPKDSGLNDYSAGMLRRCLSSVERECAIVERMLELGICESYPVNLLISEIKLHELAEKIIKIGHYSDSADILNRIDGNTVIYADRDRLYQVLNGIISNAVKYNSDPRVVEISFRKDELYNFIEITDNGNGIPPESLALIFEPFYIDNLSLLSREYGRIGLDLSIAKKYIELHGGEILVSSEKGRGSTFTVKTPVNPVNSS